MRLVKQEIPLVYGVKNLNFQLAEQAIRTFNQTQYDMTGNLNDSKEFMLKMSKLSNNTALHFVPVYIKVEYEDHIGIEYIKTYESMYSRYRLTPDSILIYTNLDVLRETWSDLYWSIITESKIENIEKKFKIKLFEPDWTDPLKYYIVRWYSDRSTIESIIKHKNTLSHTLIDTRYYDINNFELISPCDEMNDYIIMLGNKIESYYRKAKSEGINKDDLRSMLPLCIATEAYSVMRLEDLISFVKQKTDPGAHHAIRELALNVKDDLECIYKVKFN